MAKKPDAGLLTANDIFEQVYGASNSSLVFTGLIDKSGDDQSILFARGIDCQEWKKIPASTIEKVQFVQTVQCKDHTHALVHLFLKEPQSPDGRAFAAVAHLHRPLTPVSNDFRAASLATVEPPEPPLCPDGKLSWDRKRHKWICVPHDR